jgi:crotonobetainyl-CoA:carnitine CoA-transferase CaiB-like acyl-CoA transferase
LLAGLQVLDLADEKASFCSKLLADLGAEVTKVEPPDGDRSRWIGPFWENTPHSEGSLSFWYNNTNKMGITLNLEIKEEQEAFRQLASKADIIIETFSPGYLEKLGLGYDSLSKLNPGLILASVTGFGQTGPYRHYKSCDIVASATGGQMYVCGAHDTPPLKSYGEQSYYAASLFAAIGILITLRERNYSGTGQHIDVSLQEAVTATLEHVPVRYFYDGVVFRRQGGSHPNDPLYLLPCKDGYMLLVVDRDWDVLVDWLDGEGMAGDLKERRWQEEEYRRQHWSHIADILTRWTKSHTRSELLELAQLMRLPWAPIASLEEMINSPQLSERSFFVSVGHPELRACFAYPGAPFRFFAHRAQNDKKRWDMRRAPLIGEHNAQIRQEKLRPSMSEAPRLKDFKTARNALNGLRILDFSWLLAGPYATRILADFGAELIKVQSRKTATGAESNATGYFNTWNRNKLGITLNINHPKARDIALRLVKISDVVVENFTPRVKSNWGLSYDNLKEVKPDIIMLSMSAMGQTGPWRDFVALGPTIQAFSGITYLTSFPREIASPSACNDRRGTSQSAPLGLGYSYADPISGLFATLAILAALQYRDRTGQGQSIDVSEYECMCSLLGPAILDYIVNHNIATPQGNSPGHIAAAPYGCYRCSGEDRWCVIAISSEQEWQSLCRVLGNPPWGKEERFSTLSGRQKHAEELNQLLEQWTIRNTPEEVMNELQRAGVPAGMVEDANDLANDPHLKARNFFIQAEHPLLGKTTSDNTPIRLSRTPARFRRPAPLLGQDNHYVYRELLGLSEEELARYIAEGAIY